jgi:hypothetical protein
MIESGIDSGIGNETFRERSGFERPEIGCAARFWRS